MPSLDHVLGLLVGSLFAAAIWPGIKSFARAVSYSPQPAKRPTPNVRVLWGLYSRTVGETYQCESWLWGAFLRQTRLVSPAPALVPPQGGSGLVRADVPASFAYQRHGPHVIDLHTVRVRLDPELERTSFGEPGDGL